MAEFGYNNIYDYQLLWEASSWKGNSNNNKKFTVKLSEAYPSRLH